MNENRFHHIKIYRRSRLEWTLWLIWALLEVFWAQNALASHAEHHTRAGIIYWAIFGVFLLGGAVVFFVRRSTIIYLYSQEDEMEDNDK